MSKFLDAVALRGKTLTSIVSDRKNDMVHMTTSDGATYRMWHWQDCCERVSIHDIVGDLTALIGSPLVIASEEISEVWPDDVEPQEYTDSFTWTTYVFATESATVRIRWLGESNGYYSELVQIDEVTL